MRARKKLLFLSILTAGSCGPSTAEGGGMLSKENIRKSLLHPPANEIRLKEETRYGCAAIPATNLIQKLMVGVQMTEEVCSVTAHPGNKISLSFVKGEPVFTASIRRGDEPTDIFAGETEDGKLIIVQQIDGRIVSASYTSYDKKGSAIFQSSGQGDFIKDCAFFEMFDSSKGEQGCSKK